MSSLEPQIDPPDRKAVIAVDLLRRAARQTDQRVRRTQSNTYSSLMILEAACRLRNYGKAAMEVGLTRPAISMAISRLEKLTGATLFVQSGREMLPTSAAERMRAAYVSSRLQLDRAIFNAARDETTCTISLPRSLTYRWLGRRLKTMNEAIGPVQVLVRDDNAEVDFGQVDVAVTDAPDHAYGLQTEALFDETLHVAASPAASGALSGTAERYRDITYIDNRTWPLSLWESVSGIRWSEGANVIRLSDFDVALDTVIGGFGATLVPGTLLPDLVASGELAQIHHAKIPSGRRFHLNWTMGEAEDRTRPMRRWLRRQFAASDACDT